MQNPDDSAEPPTKRFRVEYSEPGRDLSPTTSILAGVSNTASLLPCEVKMQNPDDSAEPPTKRFRVEYSEPGRDLSPTTSILAGVSNTTSLLPGFSPTVTSPVLTQAKSFHPQSMVSVRPTVHVSTGLTHSESLLKAPYTAELNQSNQPRPQIHITSPRLTIPYSQTWPADSKVTFRIHLAAGKMPLPQTWPADSKVTFRVHPAPGKGVQPKSPVTLTNMPLPQTWPADSKVTFRVHPAPGKGGQPKSVMPLPQTWPADSKVTFRVHPAPGKGGQPKSPVTFTNVAGGSSGLRYPSPQVVTIQNNRLTSPTSTLSKPVVSADVKGQYQVLSKHGGDPVKMGPTTQISFQVPANWNIPGSKSLLDSSGKMSVVAFNTTEGKSLLTDQKNVSGDVVHKTLPIDGQTVAVVKTDNLHKPVGAGGDRKVLATLPGQVVASTTLLTVPRNTGAINTSSLPQKISKQGSFVISNKQYTIVPASATNQILADNKINKVTMAERQIMLPTGPAKITWPIQQQQIGSTMTESGNKQYIFTTPVLKSSSFQQQGKTVIPVNSKGMVAANTTHTSVQLSKPSTITSNIQPTAKVIINPGKSGNQAGAAGLKSPNGAGNGNQSGTTSLKSSNGAGNSGQKSTTPTKTSILPTQKNWEIVKQSSQLMPPGKIEKQSTTVITDTTKKDVKMNEILKDAKEDANISNNNSKQDANESNNNGQNPPNKEDTKKKSEANAEDDNSKIQPYVKEPVEKSTEISTEKTDKEESVEKEGMLEKEDENISSTNAEKMKERDEINMEVEDGSSETPNAETSENTDKGAEVAKDAVETLNWKDGVGELPGSNLKFRINDGVLDVVDHDLECTETLNTSNESETAEPDANKMDVTHDIKQEHMDEDVTVKEESSQEVSNKDEITQCENCGEYGFATDFYKEGKFCSQTCVGAYDSKRMRGVKKHGTMSKMVLGLKKGRKKFLLKDSLNREKENIEGAAKKSKAFVWTRYLEKENATEAPARLFKNPFPSSKNSFRVGMKLEGVDPHHQSLFCVLTVSEVCGYRIRLHFDGYSECFDFWSDIDSAYIYPVGFCEKNGKNLQPPKGYTVHDFNWINYLKLTKSTPAPKSLFSNQPVQPVTPNLFRVGSKLEAVDKKNSSLICVASVADTLGDKVLVHFDSWDDNYDYWCDMTAPFIHPCGFCDEKGYVLSPPIDWQESGGFTWERFLAKTKSQAVPARAFKSRPMVGFEPGMKVEVVDKRNPILVRVATIMEVENYIVKIHFDGWLDVYDYWLDDDSPDIHPPGWCAKTGHPLVPPLGPPDLVVQSGPGVCPTPGCKGIGHIKGPKYSGHHSTFGCPYSELNMNKEDGLGDRIATYIKNEDAQGYRMHGIQEKRQNSYNDDPGYEPGKSFNSQKVSSLSKLSPQENGLPVKRGRRPKSYYLELEEQRRAKEREQERKDQEDNLRQGIHNSVFSSAMIPTPKTEVPLCWDQHSKLLPGVTNIRGNDVGKWTINEVASFINTLPGCEEQSKLFQEQQIDGEAFLLLTQADIVKIMNIKLGPALKIFNSIIMFKNTIEV